MAHRFRTRSPPKSQAGRTEELKKTALYEETPLQPIFTISSNELPDISYSSDASQTTIPSYSGTFKIQNTTASYSSIPLITDAERNISVFLPTISITPRAQIALGSCSSISENEENEVQNKERAANYEGNSFQEKNCSYNNNASVFITAWNILPTLQGSSVFTMPYAVAIGGYAVLAAIILISYLANITGIMLIDCFYELTPQCGTKRRVRKTYADVMKAVWGENGAKILTGILVFHMFTESVTSMLLLEKSAFALLKPYTNVSFIILTCIFSVLIYPTLFVSKLTILAYFSMISAFAIIIGTITLIFIFIQQSNKWIPHFHQLPFITLKNFPLAVSIVVFSCASHIVIPQVESSMRDKKKFPRLLCILYGVSSIIKVFVGMTGAITFGADTDSILTIVVGKVNRNASFLCGISLSLYALFNYPLCMFSVCDYLDSFVENTKISDDNKLFYLWLAFTRLFLVSSSVSIGLLVPYFGIILAIKGCLIGTCLIFIFPCYFYLKLKWNELTIFNKIKVVTILTTGSVIGCFGAYYSIKQLIYK
ncbi:uncharacterized protein LOC105843308 isoform X1 [Hydra vulgaris]|uniref:uncharacterized protein LOC105843308 isoform X1 n=1 Tax=Hydra vulgaris TaxID=6087 RepID=UPI001F5F06E7|nr:amino acid transporter AVT1H-like [Hydra vulgaris]